MHIFEAGFGTGLNILLTAVRSVKEKRQVFYTAIEKFPLDEITISSLNYTQFTGLESKEIFRLIHSSEWEVMVSISEDFKLMKIRGDLLTSTIGGPFDLIYFDAFGPDKQPEMWTKDIFSKISHAATRNTIFVTYSAKGEVRRNLERESFKVTLLPGPPGKRHIIRAIKTEK